MAKLSDGELRVALFGYVDRLVKQHETPLTAEVLRMKFEVEGHSFQLQQQTGIFRPATIESDAGALIITSGVKGRYKDDSDTDSDIIRYRYQDGDSENHFNKSMRRAMVRRSPLLYLVGVSSGQYFPLYPCFIEGDNRIEKYFEISVGINHLTYIPGREEDLKDIVRRYATVLAVRRLHQSDFRVQVLQAYEKTCAICRLKLPDLIDAAHIVPDGEPRGEPVVPNGLALCKIHHAAFDKGVIGIRPDYQVEVAQHILSQSDGPMLKHGIQEVNGTRILVPGKKEQRPDPSRLEIMYDRFRQA